MEGWEVGVEHTGHTLCVWHSHTFSSTATSNTQTLLPSPIFLAKTPKKMQARLSTRHLPPVKCNCEKAISHKRIKYEDKHQGLRYLQITAKSVLSKPLIIHDLRAKGFNLTYITETLLNDTACPLPANLSLHPTQTTHYSTDLDPQKTRMEEE